MTDTLALKKSITGAIVFGDSLSDEGKKYNEDVCCCIPFKWFLHHSDYNNFTNGHTWAFIFSNILNEILKEKSNWLTIGKSTYFKNLAEGGATAFNYRNVTSFFRYFKGFILSFFLGNIQKQAENFIKNKELFNSTTKLGIILIGPNDLATLGYDDAKGVERAIQGIKNTIAILTNRDKRTGFNHLERLLLVGLPDISETPRFANKSSGKKLKMKLACQQFNQKLQELTNEYQYVNFDLCTIYNYKNINFLNLKTVRNIKKGIVVTGEAEDRTILFINNGEFITNKSNKEVKKINIKLTKEQLAIFLKEGEIKRDEKNGDKLDEFICKVTQIAKLNLDLKMIAIEPIFDEILQNPEAYEFTSGCAVYYLTKEGLEKDDIVSNNITGNAVIIKETDNGVSSYLVKAGKLLTDQKQIVKVEFELSIANQFLLGKKVKEYSSKEKIFKLVDKEDKHDICSINIIQSVVENYKKKFNKEIVLTAVDDSVLEDIKKKYLNKDAIFWDDLHPARRVHAILASKIAKFIENNYSINNPLRFRGDSPIGIKPKLTESNYAEAPSDLPSVPSLLYLK